MIDGGTPLLLFGGIVGPSVLFGFDREVSKRWHDGVRSPHDRIGENASKIIAKIENCHLPLTFC